MAAAPAYEALGVLNLCFLLIGVLILLAFNAYVVWQWRHPDDRNAWFSAKIIVVLSMLMSELVIIGLPLDVANNGGARDCAAGGDYSQCGGLDMRGYWVAISWLQMACALCFLPGFLFAYEAYDDVDHTTDCSSLIRGGVCSVLGVLVMFVAVCVPMYFSKEMNDVLRPVVAYKGSLRAFTVETYAGDASSFVAMGDLDVAVSASSSAVLHYSVSFLDYAPRVFSWLGWFLFVLWGGIGLVSLPVDYVLAYFYRPVPLDARELADLRLSVQRRTAELLDLGRQLQGERAAYGAGPRPGWLARRRHEAADQVRVNKLSQMAMILEGDVEELEICAGPRPTCDAIGAALRESPQARARPRTTSPSCTSCTWLLASSPPYIVVCGFSILQSTSCPRIRLPIS